MYKVSVFDKRGNLVRQFTCQQPPDRPPADCWYDISRVPCSLYTDTMNFSHEVEVDLEPEDNYEPIAEH